MLRAPQYFVLLHLMTILRFTALLHFGDLLKLYSLHFSLDRNRR